MQTKYPQSTLVRGEKIAWRETNPIISLCFTPIFLAVMNFAQKSTGQRFSRLYPHKDNTCVFTELRYPNILSFDDVLLHRDSLGAGEVGTFATAPCTL